MFELMNIVTGAGGLLIGALLAAIYFMNRMTGLERHNAELLSQLQLQKVSFETAQADMNNRFKVSAQEALQSASEQFLILAQERLKSAQNDSAHDLDKRQKAIDGLVKPMQEQLISLGQAIEQVKGTDTELRKDLQSLSRETARLVGALRDPSAQGQWGEYILEGLLEKSGLLKGQHYTMQVGLDDGRKRPDAIIDIRDGLKIIVDAKAPVNEMTQRLSDNLNEDDYKTIMLDLARTVRGHVQKLGAKNYWEHVHSADFTVLFLPSEHLYSLALRGDPSLPEFAASQNVIIASPTLLISLLRVVGMSWRQMELAKNASDIAALGGDLYKRLLTFTDHVTKIGKGLQSAMNGYDDAVGSLQKSVLPAARKMNELQGKTESGGLPDFAPIEKSPRVIALSEEDEREKRRA
jgi:DNA recombination protein RmuC